jgi:hypothetical protein
MLHSWKCPRTALSHLERGLLHDRVATMGQLTVFRWLRVL